MKTNNETRKEYVAVQDGYECRQYQCYDNSEHQAILNAARYILAWRKKNGMPLMEKEYANAKASMPVKKTAVFI